MKNRMWILFLLIPATVLANWQAADMSPVKFLKVVVSASGETTLLTPTSGTRIRIRSLIISVGTSPVDVDIHWTDTQADSNTFAGLQSSAKGFSKDYWIWGPASPLVDDILRTKQSSSGTVWYYIVYTEEP